MAVLLDRGQPIVYGMASGVARVQGRSGIQGLRDLLLSISNSAVTGTSVREIPIEGRTARVETAVALGGSAVTKPIFGDIDGELVVSIATPQFRRADFRNAQSDWAKAFVGFIQAHISENLAAGRIFSDFKAGEYDLVPEEAMETKSRAIKWSVDEIMAAGKYIRTRDGAGRWISLEEAVTSESRIKVDWIAKVRTPAIVNQVVGMPERYSEISLLIHPAGRRGSDPAILRLGSETVIPERGATGANMVVTGVANVLPLRLTTVYFTKEEAELARSISVNTPPPDIATMNLITLAATQTYWERGEALKVLQRLNTRLNFWNDVPVFCAGSPRNCVNLTAAKLSEEMEQILGDIDLMLLKQMKEFGSQLLRLREVGHADVAAEDEFKDSMRRLLAFQQRSQWLESDSLEAAVDFLKVELKELVYQRLGEHPRVRAYIDFAMTLQYADVIEARGSSSSFVSLRPNARFVGDYAAQVKQWRREFPGITFHPPEDLHLTVSFIGRTTPSNGARIQKIVAKFRQWMRDRSFELNDGEVRVLGRNSNLLAIVFPVEQVPAEIREAIRSLKVDLAMQGVPVDHYFEQEFLPHVTIGSLPSNTYGVEGSNPFQDFVADGAVGDELRSMTISGEIDLLSREISPAGYAETAYGVVDLPSIDEVL
jgi:2'-5' RNA ligase